MFTIKAIAATAAVACAVVANAQNASLPVVDLGYELHQASYYNATGRFFNFTNIRYAAPPVGELRFAKPQPPAVNRSSIQTGSVGRICPQAGPVWSLEAAQWIPKYLQGQAVNDSLLTSPSGNGSLSLPVQDPRTTEDCLFLDVVVPQDIFESTGYGAPVMVWIYGGGYTEGTKDGSGSPAGLLTRSESNNADGVIYVSMNYRLGAFGWLSGPTFQENGTANLGLYDQRLALEWVQNNIHLFGGDPNRVTVFGESAGGGSIMHQITAYGGNKGPAPFSQAVLQSPGWMPIVSANSQESTFNAYLALLNVTTLEEARKLPYAALQRANIIQVANSTYGGFTYGPTVDGDFVPALPGQLLAHGQFDSSLRIMVGHNADEGLLFTPIVESDDDFRSSILELLPPLAAHPDVVSYITDTLYPPIFDGSQAQNYTDNIARAAALTSEVVFTCNTHYLDKAYGNDTYSYLFAIPPALHGQDVPYTYYNANGSALAGSGGTSAGVAAPQIAVALQEYLTHFAETGNPNEKGVPYFPLFGQNATVQVLNVTGIREAMDPTANYRCDWWQKALWF